MWPPRIRMEISHDDGAGAIRERWEQSNIIIIYLLSEYIEEKRKKVILIYLLSIDKMGLLEFL